MGKFFIYLVLAILVSATAHYIYVEHKKASAPDYKAATYTIAGKKVKIGGDIKYFGNDLRKDLDGDGREDVAFLITNSPSGEGVLYYVVAALNTPTGYVGSSGVLLGDRIAPQTTESGNGKSIVVNFATRGLQDPITTLPYVGKSLRLLLDPETLQFGEIEPDFL